MLEVRNFCRLFDQGCDAAEAAIFMACPDRLGLFAPTLDRSILVPVMSYEFLNIINRDQTLHLTDCRKSARLR